MSSGAPPSSFLVVDPWFFESLDRYDPIRSHFFDTVRKRLPSSWKIHHKAAWYSCSPPNETLPEQGWKIHISSVPETASQILEAILPLLAEKAVAFKFAVDRPILDRMNSKNWPRGASGKFVTIYPRDGNLFHELLPKLALATASYLGPYILSDRRYSNSKVIFYRYGGIKARRVLETAGTFISVLRSPEGEDVPDVRAAYFHLPPWVSDPIAAPSDSLALPELKDGRYRVQKALNFSNSGGVYVAIDRQTDQQVVIKEARPYTQADETGHDAQDLLRKEHRLLDLLKDTCIGPRPIDLFTDWEHLYLVEEYVAGDTLAESALRADIHRSPNPSMEDYEFAVLRFLGILRQLTHAVSALHKRGVVFGDISPRNILIDAGLERLTLIDFEGATELRMKRELRIVTPGFVLPGERSSETEDGSGDSFAIGAIALFLLFPNIPLTRLDPSARFRLLHEAVKEYQIPDELAGALKSLLSDVPAQRLPPELFLIVLEETQPWRIGPREFSLPDPQGAQASMEASLRFTAACLDYTRSDRLAPADYRVFTTNPLSVMYGASGIAHAFHALRGRCPEDILDWIVSCNIAEETCPPGLFIGMSGIAWTLLDEGRQDIAVKIMSSALTHPLRYLSHDLFGGESGLGLACLRFFRCTGTQAYLSEAEAIARYLLGRAMAVGDFLCWERQNGCPVGLLHGASGVALFLLTLADFTANEEYRHQGEKALDFDLAQAAHTPWGGISFPSQAGAKWPLYSDLRYGGAGIGMVVARCCLRVASARYRDFLDGMAKDAARKFAPRPGLIGGLAGFGYFLLEAHDVTGDERFREAAWHVRSGLKMFEIDYQGSLAYPGEGLLRLSCDFATGGAGIALFLNRLTTGRRSHLFLDPSGWGTPATTRSPAMRGTIEL